MEVVEDQHQVKVQVQDQEQQLVEMVEVQVPQDRALVQAQLMLVAEVDPQVDKEVDQDLELLLVEMVLQHQAKELDQEVLLWVEEEDLLQVKEQVQGQVQQIPEEPLELDQLEAIIANLVTTSTTTVANARRK
jgi:hypothetical protein